MRQTLRPHAAKIRPILRVLFASLLVVSISPSIVKADNNAAERRETAKAQFDKAEKDREALESRSENARSLKEYASLVNEYKRVYLTTARAAEVPSAINEVAELYRSMGDLFDEKYYHQSIDSYQFLLREYPTDRYRETALLAIAHIEQDDLHDDTLAQKSYAQFLTLHPHSSHAVEVRVILDKLNASAAQAKSAQQSPAVFAPGTPVFSIAKDQPERVSAKAVSPDRVAPATDTGAEPASDERVNAHAAGSGPRVSRIRTWNTDTYSRVVIDVGSQVKYQAARIASPDRIYFDIEGAKLNSALLHKPIDLDQGGFLEAVRVAQNQAGVVRVVLEVNKVKDYSVFLLPDPYRLVVDVYGSSAAAEEAARLGTPAPGPTTEPPPAKAEKQIKAISAKALPAPSDIASDIKVADRVADKANSKTVQVPSGNTELAQAESNASSVSTPASISVSKPQTAMTLGPDTESAPKKSVKNSRKAAANSPVNISARTDVVRDIDVSDPKALSVDEDSATGDTEPPAARPSRVKKSSVKGKTAHDQAVEMGPLPIPELTLDGQHSLTRALGLKIGRIVIDAGHGGHDTGTIGPTGLMEKDLCLDVSLRVGKLIGQRLPAADVVYTRDDDTFIPLEQRTQIANEAQADLFLSIHANSSPDQKARGIETYYLNFTGSSDAMEVASRENALSGNSVHDLQDIVNKIARNEKIEESRDFAGIVQNSMAQRMEGINRGERNRGVRKAPFVVLIGANMPSVLAEISFVSNPSDEQWLKKPENRQRVAEGLYHGIETYLQSTNSLANNQVHTAPGTRSGIVARSGNSQ
jgi:N-acetylmuramoyl-L-alanine amidase